MKIFLGTVTGRLDYSCSLIRFLENAEKYGHKLSGVIATYSRGAHEAYVAAARAVAPLHLIDLNESSYLRGTFKKLGLSPRTHSALLDLPDSLGSGLVPYGFNRNQVAAEAILRGADVLIFIDSDVLPYVLVRKNGEIAQEDVDFFGSHLKFLNAGSGVTTGEYSGSNILPPALFDGMDDLLLGLKKENMIPYWRDCEKHRCVTLKEKDAVAGPCDKILGGNAGFRTEVFFSLPPFYSPYYTASDGFFLARGEDTVLSAALKPAGINCTEIQTPVFHDTYGNWPNLPDLRADPKARSRFYYACAGWVGRNPFMLWRLGEAGEEVFEKMRRHLVIGARAAAEYTGESRFDTLPEKFDICLAGLNRAEEEFNAVSEAWAEFLKAAE